MFNYSSHETNKEGHHHFPQILWLKGKIVHKLHPTVYQDIKHLPKSEYSMAAMLHSFVSHLYMVLVYNIVSTLLFNSF